MSTGKGTYGNPETRARILTSAWELVEETGSAMTLADVADKAGVSRQAVYLHFEDRSGLLVSLVEHVDASLGWADLRSHILGAPSGVESLRRWVETMSWYSDRIDRLSQVVETNQHRDQAMAAAWRNRMDGRRLLLLAMMERVAGEGRLASGWSAAAAADVVYVCTMPGPWREWTHELGWSSEEYHSRVWSLLSESLLRKGDEDVDSH